VNVRTSLAALLLLVTTVVAAQELRIDKPKQAVILFESGRQYVGILHSLNSKEVRFQILGKLPVTYAAEKVKAVQTTDEMLVYNSEKRQFQQKETPPVAKQPDPVLKVAPVPPVVQPPVPNPPNVQDAGAAFQSVLAEGAGISLDSALKDAFRSAVRQVVGAVVDTETLIKNDDIISDKILTYSDGFIQTYKELSKSEKDGLHRIKIQASVERRSVVSKLKAVNVMVREVDGQGVFAKVVSELDAEKNAHDITKQALQGLRGKLIEAEVVGEPQVVQRDASRVTLRFQVRLKANADAYAKQAEYMVGLLERVARSKGTLLAVAKPQNSSIGPAWEMQEMTKVPVPNGRVTVVICTGRTVKDDRTSWVYFLMDEAVRPALQNCNADKLTVKLSLQTADAKTITEDSFSSSEWPRSDRFASIVPRFAINWRHANNREASFFVISPFFHLDAHGDFEYAPSIIVTRDISLSLDEVRQMKRVKCEVVH